MSFFAALVTSKLAVGVLTAGVVAVGGTTVAAYAGALPAPLQQSAHSLIGAPAPSEPLAATETAEPTETASESPDARPTAMPTEAAFGRCTAYTKGGLNSTSTAYAALAAVAGGPSHIAAYCATVLTPGRAGAHATDPGRDSTHAPKPGRDSTHAPAAPAPPSQAGHDAGADNGATHGSGGGRP